MEVAIPVPFVLSGDRNPLKHRVTELVRSSCRPEDTAPHRPCHGGHRADRPTLVIREVPMKMIHLEECLRCWHVVLANPTRLQRGCLSNTYKHWIAGDRRSNVQLDARKVAAQKQLVFLLSTFRNPKPLVHSVGLSDSPTAESRWHRFAWPKHKHRTKWSTSGRN